MLYSEKKEIKRIFQNFLIRYNSPQHTELYELDNSFPFFHP